MDCFLVGGAVRDELLGLEVHERDWVVVGGTPRALLDLGFSWPDSRFPVFLHPHTGDEYALARRETKSGLGHRAFQFESGPDVTLEQDLARRDLRVNAIARGDDGTLIDPFGGRNDLDRRTLRHVTRAFVEDPLRVLRAARFASVLAPLGFSIHTETAELMRTMATDEEFRTLSAERVWRETAKAVAGPVPRAYFDVLSSSGALESLLGPGLGAPPTDGLERIAGALSDSRTRLAAFAAAWRGSAAGTVAAGLGADRAHRELAQLVGEHGTPLLEGDATDAESLMALLEALDALRRPERVRLFAEACRGLALARGRSDPASQVERAFEAARRVEAQSLLAEGVAPGPALGAALRERRIDAIERMVLQ